VRVRVGDPASFAEEVFQLGPTDARRKIFHHDAKLGAVRTVVISTPGSGAGTTSAFGRDGFRKRTVAHSATFAKVLVLISTPLGHFYCDALALDPEAVELLDGIGGVPFIFKLDKPESVFEIHVQNAAVFFEGITNVLRSDAPSYISDKYRIPVFAHSVRQSKSDSKMG